MNKKTEDNLIPPLKSINHLLKIVNLTLLLMVLPFFSMTAQPTGKARTDIVTLSVKKQTVQTVLNEIERQTGYLFMVNSTVDTKRKVSVSVNKLYRKFWIRFSREQAFIMPLKVVISCFRKTKNSTKVKQHHCRENRNG